MKISFIIPAYNEEAVLAQCLSSIQQSIQTTQISDLETEIIVVNNASTDHTKEVALAFSGVQVVDEMRKGIVWARQAGFHESTGDILANIDADTIMPKKWLATVISEFEHDPKLLGLSGPYQYYDAPISTRILTFIFYVIGYAFNFIGTFFGFGSMLQGGNFVLRRKALEQIGGFDTSIEFYGEDTDIGKRVNKIGKVKWTFGLPMYSSARRLNEQGLIKAGVLYIINFFSIVFSGKPATQTYKDIRSVIKTRE